jgi:hypothetical protein
MVTGQIRKTRRIKRFRANRDVLGETDVRHCHREGTWQMRVHHDLSPFGLGLGGEGRRLPNRVCPHRAPDVLGADLNCSESRRLERSHWWLTGSRTVIPPTLALPRAVSACHGRWRSRRRARGRLSVHTARLARHRRVEPGASALWQGSYRRGVSKRGRCHRASAPHRRPAADDDARAWSHRMTCQGCRPRSYR